MTSSLAVFEAVMWVKSTHLIKSKREILIGNKRSFRRRIHSLLRRADARGNADTVSDAYRKFAGQA